MNKLKKATKYLKENIKHNMFEDPFRYNKDLIKAIKEAQKDTIEYVLQQAADSATCTYNNYEDFVNGNETYIVDKQSILSLKDKLIKELE